MKTITKSGLRLWVFFTIFTSTLLVTSCKSEEEGDAASLDKKASIEMPVQVNHISADKDELVITYTIWKDNVAIGTKVVRDTIPALGLQLQEAENADGDVINVQVPTEYNIYVTLKPGNPLPENQ
ncbi:hypothetical protein [Xanthocytophaga flava]|uniref:hypothetical protein n=1 Tax=Xanthocytophaga flava TaxID=3048013 RepID=UPI0028D07EA9|nr:hypothetical protein [Xanthocytophaga flavus]MDJ1468963.1 hypothetical protein [Xanthocytophaga flavus]